MKLFKRRNKHGQYIYYVDYFFQGKRFQRKASEDRKEAEDILAGIRTKINEDTFKIPIKRRDKPENRCKIQTFDDLAKEVFENFIKSNTAQPDRYRSRINTIGKFFKGKKLADITSFTIEQYKKWRKESGVKESSLNRDLSCLGVLFGKAVEWKAMSENPMKAIKRFKEEDQLKNFKPLTDPQEEDLIAACGWTQNQQTKAWFEDTRMTHLKPIVTIAIDTGMRLSEILSLKWSQIDFDDALITLTRTKNHKPRQIPISARLMAVLKDWRSWTEGNDWLFCSKIDGEAIGTVKKSFTSARRKAKVRIHFHGLRHGFATKLLAAGVDIKTVQELMGHTSITTTARYLHTGLDKKRAAIEALAKARQPVENSPNCDLSVTRDPNLDQASGREETLSVVYSAG